MLNFLFQNAVASNVLSQSYAVPEPYSFIIAIAIIALAIWLGYVFIKDIIKVIFVLIGLYLLASIGYSFLTTGTLGLQGIAGFTTSILEFFKFIISAPHAISNAAPATSIMQASNSLPNAVANTVS
ncbi:MAG: hypothetical protein ACP5P2_02760 [Candidatus Micrarchaeia archaeon]